MSQPARRPAAEVSVDTELVRALLRAQHPDLASLPIIELTAGWDNFIFRLGEDMAIRLPRRLASVTTLENELRWLPVIADQLPVPVPSPLRIGKPGNRYPWSWSIVPWLNGETADSRPLGEDQAKPLVRFLKALHVKPPPDAPSNPSRGVPLRQRAAATEERLDRLAQQTPLITGTVRSAWESALQASPDEEPTWLHGDLHPGNILVDNGDLSAVIDWADISAGDRATDLASIWMLLPTVASRESAIAQYDQTAAALWSRAVGWAVSFGTLLLETGLADTPHYAEIGAKTLQRIAEGPR